MENSLIGAIAAGVVCGVLFIITVAIVCYLIYRCRRYEDEKSSQHDPLMNGHIVNGGIPTVAAMVPVPIPAPSPTRQVYQFPTMPVRHMASYRPRYIEEIKPTGYAKPDVAVRSNTYSGGFTPIKGPVFYDVRQHGYRGNRDPIARRSQEEAVATMTLGEESPKSERHFILEENNNKLKSSINKESSVDSNRVFNVAERRSFRAQDIRIPSPDEKRRSYLFNSDADPPSPEVKPANEDIPDTPYTVTKESTNQGEDNLLRDSRRQRRGDEGSVLNYPPPDYD